MKKISQTPAVATASLLETAWRAAQASTATARLAMQGRNPLKGAEPEERIRFLAARVGELEAVDEETSARNALAIELEGCEPSDDEERADAHACNAATLQADLAELIAEEDRAEAARVAARQRTVERLARARIAFDALTARRYEQRLPPPRALPLGVMTLQGYDESPRAIISALEQRADAPSSPRANAGLISTLRAEENELRTAAERERERVEEAEAEAAQIRKDQAEDRAAFAKATAAKNRAIDVANAKDRADAQRLADAHRARTAP